MTRPTLPSSGPPDDFSENDGNGRHRRVPQPHSDLYRRDSQPTFTPRDAPSEASSHARGESPYGEQRYEGYSYPGAESPYTAQP
jgi:hypothetical protein